MMNDECCAVLCCVLFVLCLVLCLACLILCYVSTLHCLLVLKYLLIVCLAVLLFHRYVLCRFDSTIINKNASLVQ